MRFNLFRLANRPLCRGAQGAFIPAQHEDITPAHCLCFASAHLNDHGQQAPFVFGRAQVVDLRFSSDRAIQHRATGKGEGVVGQVS